jgi:hypothetical protein
MAVVKPVSKKSTKKNEAQSAKPETYRANPILGNWKTVDSHSGKSANGREWSVSRNFQGWIALNVGTSKEVPTGHLICPVMTSQFRGSDKVELTILVPMGLEAKKNQKVAEMGRLQWLQEQRAISEKDGLIRTFDRDGNQRYRKLSMEEQVSLTCDGVPFGDADCLSYWIDKAEEGANTKFFIQENGDTMQNPEFPVCTICEELEELAAFI